MSFLSTTADSAQMPRKWGACPPGDGSSVDVSKRVRSTRLIDQLQLGSMLAGTIVLVGSGRWA